MDIAVLGIDLGKNSCSLVGLDSSGKVILRRRMQRKTIVSLASKLSPCIVAMEACCGAHHLGRVLSAQAHTVRLMSPEYVRPPFRVRLSFYPALFRACRDTSRTCRTDSRPSS